MTPILIIGAILAGIGGLASAYWLLGRLLAALGVGE